MALALARGLAHVWRQTRALVPAQGQARARGLAHVWRQTQVRVCRKSAPPERTYVL